MKKLLKNVFSMVKALGVVMAYTAAFTAGMYAAIIGTYALIEKIEEKFNNKYK